MFLVLGWWFGLAGGFKFEIFCGLIYFDCLGGFGNLGVFGFGVFVFCGLVLLW